MLAVNSMKPSLVWPVLCFLLAAGLALAGLPASAGDAIAAREIRASARLSEANYISHLAGRYVNVRDHFYYSDTGLVRRTELFEQLIDGWIKGWIEIFSLAGQEFNPRDPAPFQEELEGKISKQQAELVRMSEIAGQINRLSEDSLRILTVAIPEFPVRSPDSLPIHRDLIERREELKDAIIKLREFPRGKLSQLHSIGAASRMALTTKLKNKLQSVGRNEILTEIERLEKRLRAESFIAPSISTLVARSDPCGHDCYCLDAFSSNNTASFNRFPRP